jgi:hypothetical protein
VKDCESKTIFHEFKYSEEFIKEHLEKHPVNIFEVTYYNQTILHCQKFSEEFIKEQLKIHPTNLFKMTGWDRKTIFHCYAFSDKFVREHLELYPTYLFDLKDDYGILMYRCKELTRGIVKEGCAYLLHGRGY